MNELPRPTREEKLAAKLRENLRRRKAQARELPRAFSPDFSENGPDSSLPKAEPDS
jgi:hypothetical protein